MEIEPDEPEPPPPPPGTMIILNDSSLECALCGLEPPPDGILRIPPPPVPGFLLQPRDHYYPLAVGPAEAAGPARGPEGRFAAEAAAAGPCRDTCEWRAEGVQYVEMPQQGTIFDDTWLLVLISACIGVIFIGIALATLLIKCKLQAEVNQTNDAASQCSNRSSNKNSTLSTSTASSSMQTTTTSGGGIVGGAQPCILSSKSVVRLHSEAVLHPCAQHQHHHHHQQQSQQQQQDSLQDSRVMWATLTPRGTTRHHLEEHTYETIGGAAGQQQQQQQLLPAPPPPPPPPPPGYYEASGHRAAAGPLAHHIRRSCTGSPTEHTYAEPPAPSPIIHRPKDEKAFDNTAFVDYEEPLSLKNEYYQLEDVLEPCDSIFSVQGVYGLSGSARGLLGPPHGCLAAGTLRPRVSSPTRIEHPNLPPLNLQPLRKHPSRRSSASSLMSQHAPDCTLLRGGGGGGGPTTHIPNI